MRHIFHFAALALTLGALPGCSSSSSEGSTGPAGANAQANGGEASDATNSDAGSTIGGGTDTSSGGATASAGAQSAAATSLVGSWQFNSDPPGLSIVLHIEADGTYESNIVTFPTSSFWDDQIERGTYTVAGSTLTTTPKQWSCPGPDPVASSTFSFTDGALVIANAKGAISYPPQPTENGGIPAGVAVTVGCYGSNSSFTPMPLAPVAN
jgi:hypothetical protein